MIGTLINCAAIILGSAVGLLFRKGMKKKMADTVMQGVGLCVMLIGLSGALETQNTLLVIISMVIGGVVGSWIDIDDKMNRLGAYAQRKLTRGDDENNTFAKGFVTASLIFCCPKRLLQPLTPKSENADAPASTCRLVANIPSNIFLFMFFHSCFDMEFFTSRTQEARNRRNHARQRRSSSTEDDEFS